MVQWVAGWIPHGEPIEIFLVLAIVPQLVLSCLWDGAFMLIRMCGPCGNRGFPLSLSEWSFTI